MPVAIRPFERRDRDQLAALVNLHVAAVLPGVLLSVNAVLSQLEREPYETVIDPWVAERVCLIAERDAEVVAAALLHRFGADVDVGQDYRDRGEIRWLVCKLEATEAGAELLGQVLEQMRAWRVRLIGAECSLPALGCYGVPDSLPHIRRLLVDAGFGEPTRTERVLVARCDALAGRPAGEHRFNRSLGLLGARFTLSVEHDEVGFIEVCDHSAEMARSSVAARWADVGNLIVPNPAALDWAMPALLAVAAEWLLLGGVTRLIDYWAADVDPPAYLAGLERAGFRLLVANERGFERAP